MHPHLTRQLAADGQRDFIPEADRARAAAPARRMRKRALLAAALPLALGALSLPSQADAAVADVGNTTLFITDSTGNQNDNVSVSQLSDGRLLVRDGNLGITPGRNCLPSAEGVVCSGARQILAQLFDGRDQLNNSTSLPTLFLGGAGNDVLLTGFGPGPSDVDFRGDSGRDTISYAGADRGVSVTKDDLDNDGRAGVDRDNVFADVEVIEGSQFADSLNGNARTGANEQFLGFGGDDVMSGHGGLDTFTMSPQADGADRIFGGADSDTVEYDRRTAGVTVNLSDGGADDGEAGERDELREIERALTGSGNDTLKVNPASTTGVFLAAGLGVDTIVGTDADDSLSALGGGRDTIDARGGADTIATRDREADSLACGQGTDTVRTDSPSLDLQTGCEKVDSVGVLRLADRSLVARAGATTALSVDWTLPRTSQRLARVVVRLRDGDRPVGEMAIAPRTGRMTAGGAVALAPRTSSVRRTGRTVRARIGVRLDPSLAGRRLVVDVEATDTTGRRQLVSRAGTLRVRG